MKEFHQTEIFVVFKIAEKQYNMLKFVSRKHKCKTIPEDKFTTVTQYNKDARGRKVKETIEGAAFVKVVESDENCRPCLKYLGRNALDKMNSLDEMKVFEHYKLHDNITHIHFHPRR